MKPRKPKVPRGMLIRIVNKFRDTGDDPRAVEALKVAVAPRKDDSKKK
jgi:hypothetical protein